MKTYRDDDKRRRCLACDGYVAEGARTCTRCTNKRKAARADARAARKADEREAKRTAEAEVAARWRRNTLRRHVAGLLATKSGSAERARYFANNPIAGIFQ